MKIRRTDLWTESFFMQRLREFVESDKEKLSLEFNKDTANRVLRAMMSHRIMEDRMMEIRRISGKPFVSELNMMLHSDEEYDLKTCETIIDKKPIKKSKK